MPLIDFAYSKHGTNTVGLTIFTHTDLIEEKPDLVRRFVKATVRSFEAATKEPEASIKAGPEGEGRPGDRAVAGPAQGRPRPHEDGGDQGACPTGHFALKDWEDTVELMKKYMALETTLKTQDFFTNDFMPELTSGCRARR